MNCNEENRRYSLSNAFYCLTSDLARPEQPVD
jgi:hypothetical protein